jgi:hypothetical protein
VYLRTRFAEAQAFGTPDNSLPANHERAVVLVPEYAEWEGYARTEIEKLEMVITGHAAEQWRPSVIADQAWACVLQSMKASPFRLDRFPKYLENCKKQLHDAVFVAVFGDGRDDLGMSEKLRTYVTDTISPAFSRDITFTPSSATVHIGAITTTLITMVLQGLPGIGSAKLRELCEKACRDAAAAGVFRKEACADHRRKLRARTAHLQTARETIVAKL